MPAMKRHASSSSHETCSKKTHRSTVLDDLWRHMRDTIECTVCMEIITGEMLQCACSHLLCRACYDVLEKRDAEDYGICPSCHYSVDGRNYSLEKIVSSLPMDCPNKEDGCDYHGAYSTMKEHRQHCDFRPINCIVDGCFFSGSTAKLISHLSRHSHIETQPMPDNAGHIVRVADYKKCDFWKKDNGGSVQVVTFDDNIFIRKITVVDDVLAVHVVFLGEEKSRKNYLWEVIFQDDTRTSFFRNHPISKHEDLSRDAIRTLPGVTIDKTTVRKLLDKNGHLDFRLRIINK